MAQTGGCYMCGRMNLTQEPCGPGCQYGPEDNSPTLGEINKALSVAVLEVVGATRAYLPPDGIDAQECLNRIIGATDNPTINPIIAEIENGVER